MSDPNSIPSSPRRGIGAVGIGMRLIDILASRGALKLKDLAAAAGLAPPKAHRYLASLVDAGMVAQDGPPGVYALGPMALRIGVAALARHDVVQKASDGLADLRDRIRATCFVSAWSDRGPVILKWEDSQQPVTVVVRVGSVMPLLTSATGRAYLAFLPPTQLDELRAEEEAAAKSMTKRQIDSLIEETRRQGLGRVTGEFQPDIASLAAPLFAPTGEMVGAVTALGRSNDIDSRADGVVALALRDFANSLSALDR